MNRPSYKTLWIEEKEKTKAYRNGLDYVIEAIKQLGLDVPVNENFRLESTFGYGRRITITNGDKVRWIAFKIGDSNE